MLLIFALRRPDVLPVDDFGVREGFRVLHGLEAAAQAKGTRASRRGFCALSHDGRAVFVEGVGLTKAGVEALND